MSDYELVWPLRRDHYLLPPREERNALTTAMPYMGGELVSPKKIRPPKKFGHRVTQVADMNKKQCGYLPERLIHEMLDLHKYQLLSAYEIAVRCSVDEWQVDAVLAMRRGDL